MEWKAKWINPENYEVNPKKRYPASYLKTSFKIDKGQRTILKATARGTYAVFINGQRAGKEVLTPGPLQEPEIYYCQSVDLTPYIHGGINEIMVVLMDGWHRGSMCFNNVTNMFGTDLAFIGQIEADGKVICQTDESWQASQEGPLRLSDLMLGETYDFSKDDIESWHEVKIVDFSLDKLAEQTHSPIMEHECFHCKELVSPKGERILDFGQNLAGYLEISIKGKKGQTAIFEMTESLDKDGNFQNKNFQGLKKSTLQKVTLLLKDGLNEYKTLGSFFGFRYAKVSGDAEVTSEDVIAKAVYNDFRFVGQFSCGLEQVNQFFANAVWSFKSNYIGIPTDCPTREKEGWTGDYEAYIETGMYLGDIYKDSVSYLEQYSLDQLEDGNLPQWAPCSKGSTFMYGASGWSDAIAIIPEALARRYNDSSVLERFYEPMKKWADFELSRAMKKTHFRFRKNPYKDYLLDTGFQYGEWLEPGMKVVKVMMGNLLNGTPEVSTAYLFNTCRIVSHTAALLNKSQEAEKYADLAIKCKKAYNWQFVKDGQLIDSEHMCDYVRPLMFGLLEPEVAKKAAEALNDKLVANHYIQNTGFLSTHALLRVLVDYGYAETAYKTFLHPECPGWMYPISKGATSIWETWNGIDEQGEVKMSLNHYTYGAAVSFLFDSVCGIRLEDGKLLLCPHPYEAMKHAEASYDSPLGRIVSNWKFKDGKVSYHFEVPIKATLSLPGQKDRLIDKGKYDF